MKLGRKVSPALPDSRFVEWLHRGHDAGVSFHSKTAAGKFVDIGALPATGLSTAFPTLHEHLRDNCYFSVNGVPMKAAKRRACPSAFGFERGAEHIRWITSLFADMDLHKGGISIADAENEIADLSRAELIPQPSALLYSGQGLWAFWRLASHGQSPLRAAGPALQALARAQAQLLERLACLECDMGVKDISRITRVPGSINTKSGARVGFRFVGDGSSYGLAEIVAILDESSKVIVNMGGTRMETGTGDGIFDLSDADRACAGEAAAPKRASTSLEGIEPKERGGLAHERGKKGEEALNRYRLRQLEVLYLSRGGFQEGCRSIAIRLYCQFMRGRGWHSHEEIRQAARKLGARCVPPLPTTECDSAFNWAVGGNKRGAGDTSISGWLDITIKEESHLASECGSLPSTWRRAAKYYPGGVRPVEASNPSRKEKEEKRRALIADFLESKRHDSPTEAEARAYLLSNGIEKVGKGTLLEIMKKEGWIPKPRKHAPR